MSCEVKIRHSSQCMLFILILRWLIVCLVLALAELQAKMMPCSVPVRGDFIRPGANNACACADPALASMWEWQNVICRGRAVQYNGNSGIGMEVRIFINRNGGIEMDIAMECRRAARALIRHAVLAALSRQH